MHWFDIILTIVSLYSIFKGYRSGFIRQLAALAGIVACVFLSDRVALIIQPYIADKVSSLLLGPVTFMVAFVLIFVAFMLLGYMLQSIFESSKKLGFINRFLGAVLCWVKWMLMLSILLNVVLKMDRQHLLLPADIEMQSKFFRFIKPIAPAIAPYLKFDLE